MLRPSAEACPWRSKANKRKLGFLARKLLGTQLLSLRHSFVGLLLEVIEIRRRTRLRTRISGCGYCSYAPSWTE